jgi:hypothetical protein
MSRLASQDFRLAGVCFWLSHDFTPKPFFLPCHALKNLFVWNHSDYLPTKNPEEPDL